MDITIHNTKDIIVKKIIKLKHKSYYLDIVFYDENNNKTTMSLFSDNKENLRIQKIKK